MPGGSRRTLQERVELIGVQIRWHDRARLELSILDEPVDPDLKLAIDNQPTLAGNAGAH